MGRLKELEEKLAEAKRAQQAVLDKIGECLSVPVTTKAKMWDAVVPFIKTACQHCIDSGGWNQQELKEVVFEKAMKAVLGEDAFSHLEKIR